MPIYRTGLSAKGFKRLAEEVKAYRLRLDKKCDDVVKRLSDLGVEDVKATLANHIDSGETIGSVHIEESSDGTKARMTIVVESEAILFLEFGTGITYSGVVNPKASEMGYGPGTFDGKGHWDDPNGWYYPTGETNEKGEDVYAHTYGIAAVMPMYKASVAMRNEIVSTVREVFRND